MNQLQHAHPLHHPWIELAIRIGLLGAGGLAVFFLGRSATSLLDGLGSGWSAAALMILMAAYAILAISNVVVAIRPLHDRGTALLADVPVLRLLMSEPSISYEGPSVGVPMLTGRPYLSGDMLLELRIAREDSTLVVQAIVLEFEDGHQRRIRTRFNVVPNATDHQAAMRAAIRASVLAEEMWSHGYPVAGSVIDEHGDRQPVRVEPQAGRIPLGLGV